MAAKTAAKRTSAGRRGGERTARAAGTRGAGAKTAVLVASGDLRRAANVTCWPAQQALERDLATALGTLGWSVRRGHPERWSDEEPHGFISSQAMGREVFAEIDREAPVIVAEAVWQYSHHVLIGLQHHRGPVLLVSNWSGQWPGLVGLLNLRASLTKAGVKHSVLWGEDFAAPEFLKKLGQWCASGTIRHDVSHAKLMKAADVAGAERKIAARLAEELRRRPAILGVFDEGCMGMYNAIVPDDLLHGVSMFKERLSQSGLFAAMRMVRDEEADVARRWLDERGMTFHTGRDEATELTDAQIREQLKMYIAAARLAEEFGCDAVGIQYQQGLKDLTPASDLAEGLLNCSERPPVKGRSGEIRAGRPITHFNEVDECAGIDGVLTERAWRALGMAGDNTLHDLRWADVVREGRPGGVKADEYVWVLEISGAAPASHFGGYDKAHSYRQPAMYFRLGGGTLAGVSKAGQVVWSRVYVEGGRLWMDIGRGEALELSAAETTRRREATTKEWPIMHARVFGVTRDQMMAKHQSNHVQVVYAPSAALAERGLRVKAGLAMELGIGVRRVGKDK